MPARDQKPWRCEKDNDDNNNNNNNRSGKRTHEYHEPLQCC